MRKLVIVGVSIAVVLGGAYLAYHFLTLGPAPTSFGKGVALSCPALPNECPGIHDVDVNGCPNFNATTHECFVTLDYYKEYGGCLDDHKGMAFYVNPNATQPSKYHIASFAVLHPVAVEFTQIDCNTHAPIGPIGAGQPFLSSGDDFSAYQWRHVSGTANPQAYDQCFKVIVQPKDADCIDPHIIIKGD